MTSVQGFIPTKISVKANEEPNVPDIFPHFKIIQTKWASLLGSDNKEITRVILLNSPKLYKFILTTREKFKTNHTNFRKFPKMNEEDWE